MYRRIIAEEAIKVKTQARNDQDKPKYEYDSDEDCADGTWEHKKRRLEMEKTLSKSTFVFRLISAFVIDIE